MSEKVTKKTSKKQPPASFADKVQNWEGLIRAYDEHADLLVNAQPQRQTLAAILTQAQMLKARQKLHIGLKQQATQELDAVMVNGEEAARCLRRAVAANAGTRSEILAQFDIGIVRPRSNKKPGVEAPEPSPKPVEPQPPIE
jgi:hypothetical protein